MISKKICLVGDFGVGKTSLIRKFVDRQFSDQYLSTVGVKISRKKVDLPKTEAEKKNFLQLLIWDLEGHTKFKAIAPSYLQGASGAIVVADVTRQETIENLSERLDLFLSVNPKSVAILALNKSDLVDVEIINQLLSKFEHQEDERVIATYSTSAKTGENVDEIFEKLSYRMLEKIG
ncbi:MULTISPECIES: Rab family GTPase [Okeania]|uniref:GTP-binding protein n=1 Tax=Okeania hirsuta TaxID=1458930 RepID=A0A3N6MKF5_9CYAN|nr:MULTISPECIES: Rab family GTPase [Okeania]NET14924.1 GTP-binding protein [Okeania sp. SIO1H6]NES78489.1 GTP-binding protein [Okeania sp. SIO1H4]NET22020.1 GTP-binding protein [Okeania sp. SIO1H5]NET96956.1 GTP-binding protein [Okeania sp. SIO1H2]RQH04018.1 GTP-binding protein [Okeania hirsuta]